METAVIKKTLVLAACREIATGLALLVVPSLVGRLLLGADLSGIAIPVARVLDISLVSLGVACWPDTPQIGMLIYSAAVMLYLSFLGFATGFPVNPSRRGRHGLRGFVCVLFPRIPRKQPYGVRTMPRTNIEEDYRSNFATSGMGAPAKESRIALGALIIKEHLGITDEETVAQIRENPYLQTS